MIKSKDEELHPIGKGEHWQESWYFNWADTRHDVFGLTRIGFRFRQHSIDGVVLTIRKGKPEYIYPAVGKPYKDESTEYTATKGIRAGRLVYIVREPLRSWQLILEGRNRMDLNWSAFTPAFDYHESDGELTPNVAKYHFEQSGKITGWTCFKGGELEICGFGQRDKSWGVRDWDNIEGWNWISAQFGEDLSFNVWEGFLGGKRYLNGFVFREGKNHPIERLNIFFQWGRRNHQPKRAELEIEYGHGKRLDLTAHALGQFPLFKKGLWVQEAYAKFKARVNGRDRDGFGVIEHVWNAGMLRTIARAPQIAGIAARLLLR